MRFGTQSSLLTYEAEKSFDFMEITLAVRVPFVIN